MVIFIIIIIIISKNNDIIVVIILVILITLLIVTIIMILTLIKVVFNNKIKIDVFTKLVKFSLEFFWNHYFALLWGCLYFIQVSLDTKGT